MSRRASRFHLVALGCPKARVEAEATLAALTARGLRPTDDPRRADVLVVHTCSFVEDARKESVDTLLELAATRTGRRRPRLVAVGCLPQRYGEDLLRMLPEVDAVVGCNDLAHVVDAALGSERVLLSGTPDTRELEPLASRPSQLRHVRYLKVSEGCSRRCAFCAIPAIRGPARSRPPGTLLEEARRMVGDGAVELVLVDGPAPESEWLRVGRTAAQAPEIDGVTYLTGGLPPAGKLVAARITRTSDSDLVGEPGMGPVSRSIDRAGWGRP